MLWRAVAACRWEVDNGTEVHTAVHPTPSGGLAPIMTVLKLKNAVGVMLMVQALLARVLPLSGRAYSNVTHTLPHAYQYYARDRFKCAFR
jgi:hypothetical protein